MTSNIIRRCLFLFLLLSANLARATSYLPMTLAEGVDRSDAVVLATVERADDAKPSGWLRIELVLKGDDSLERIEMAHLGLVMDSPLPDGMCGVFLLRQNPEGSLGFLFHPVAIQTAGDPAERAAAVRNVQRMLEDPVPFIRDPGQKPSGDLVYVLGQRLKALSVTSPQNPSLNAEALGYGRFTSSLDNIPWEIRDRLTVRMQSEPLVRITTDQPDSPLLPCFRERLTVAAEWDRIRPLLQENLDITIDTHQPETVGEMDAEEVRQYLRDLMKPDIDFELVIELFRSLALARDLDAIDQVATLLDSEEYLAGLAANWLGSTRSTKAIDPLQRFLERSDLQSSDYNRAIAEASKALCQIGDPAILPFMRTLMQQPQGRGHAAYALGRFGEKSDFERVLLAGNAAPGESSSMQTAMFWLVKRSNLRVEEWMVSSTWNHEIGQAKQPLWQAWWHEHQNDFRIERSYEQAFSDK